MRVSNKNKRITIIGAGLAGLSTAYFLQKKGIDAALFEKERKAGGLCRSIRKKGFTFDFSGHFLHFRNKKTHSLIKKILNGNLAEHKRNASIFSHGKFIPYPFQANLNYLPKGIKSECIDKFVEASQKRIKFSRSDSFLDWVNQRFGEGITKHFFKPYNLKFWRIPLGDLSYKWAERFITVPKISDVIAATDRKKQLGYHSVFWYPRKGGIEGLIKGVASNIKNVHLRHSVEEIDINRRTIKFNNGLRKKFDTLISTMPLPELGKIINSLPKDILKCFGKLRWVSIYNINFGIKGKVPARRHWVYFPNRDTCFFRAGFFHNISSSLVPKNSSSLYAEVSYSKEYPIDKKMTLEQVKEGLAKVGILNGHNQIICQQINNIKYGYPVYDKNYAQALKEIMIFLNKKNIIPCGRYGSWQYFSMEDVLLGSRNLAYRLG